MPTTLNLPRFRLINQSINQSWIWIWFFILSTQSMPKRVGCLRYIYLKIKRRKHKLKPKKPETRSECRREVSDEQRWEMAVTYLVFMAFTKERQKGWATCLWRKTPETQFNTKNMRKAWYLRQSPALVLNVLDQLCVYYSVNIEIPVRVFVEVIPP